VQYESDAECCALCAAIVGNPTDKSTLCCRTGGLSNASLSDAQACTFGGPFGTLDTNPTGECGSQGVQLCNLVEHACSMYNLSPTCPSQCTSMFGNGSTTYQAGDTSATMSGAMTFVLRALSTPDGTQHQTDCNQIFAIVCPVATGG
jgi:hypothetical protein